VGYRLEQQTNPPRPPIRPRSFLRPEIVSPRLDVPRHIPRPLYVGAAEPPALAEEIQIQDDAGVAGMRAAGRLAALIRDFVGSLVRVNHFTP
jgi:methionyl aminopeptidase